jgi:hypothetical protein
LPADRAFLMEGTGTSEKLPEGFTHFGK